MRAPANLGLRAEDQPDSFDYAAREWTAHVVATPDEVHHLLHRIVHDNLEVIRARYGQYVALDPGISEVLVNDSARAEFTEIFVRWVTGVTTLPPDPADLFCEKQAEAGRMMARMGLPPHALSRAMRRLKLWFLDYLAEQQIPRDLAIETMRALLTMLDLSVEIKEISYHRSTTSHARIEEAYRLHALGQNLAMERERQRASLMEWGHKLLTEYHREGSDEALPRLWKSDFGLWATHKAGLLFDGAQELGQMTDVIDRIDEMLVPQLEQASHADRASLARLMQRIEEELAAVKYLLAHLFDARLEIENGRDPLTQLLNRRFLPAVLKREIALNKAGSERGFSVIVIDIDHFKAINDLHGHLVGDTTLQQVADVIAGHARPSDFAFRYGGEEFVLVLVDCDLAMAGHVAERLRDIIARRMFQLADGTALSVTASLGVAAFHGDFDYETLLERADQAMFVAKRDGRNRVVLAPL
jgi:diguanylate cyclase